MPRLTDADYLSQRKKLRSDWFDHHAHGFSYLSSREQYDLHRYFAVAKLFGEEELLAHRAEVTKTDPSLPQRAGRAFAAVQPHLEIQLPQKQAPISHADRRSSSGRWCAQSPTFTSSPAPCSLSLKLKLEPRRRRRD